MRARMALVYAGITWEHREIALRDKPAHMLDISPKGSVPVLQLTSGRVIDESLDIMLWALEHNDPERWLPDQHRHDAFALIERNDAAFKQALDRYKYPNRYPDEDCSGARDVGVKILNDLDQRIAQNGALSGTETTIADIAIFPFIRQFAHVEKDWFYALPMPHLQACLQKHLESALFKAIMKKYPIWTPESAKTYIEQ
tara:strand:+ start:45365 stop:45961 length:597 start_codon:yes stop_codon:yes gene_type:complete